MINNLLFLDYVLIVITTLFVFFSIWKGFIQSILGLMTWIGSIIITVIFYEKLSIYLSLQLNQINFLENTGLSQIISKILSIIILFIIVLIILRKIKKLITSDIDRATLGIIIDKLFGIIYGLFFSYFVFSVILFLINQVSDNLSFYLIENSNILFQIDLINEIYIYKHLPFLFSQVENNIN